MPIHRYDDIKRLKYFLDEELRKGREPGAFKIRRFDGDYRLFYYSYNGRNLSTETASKLVNQALHSFKSKDPRGYMNFVLNKDLEILI